MKGTISVRHSGNIGDTWAAIPAMRELSRQEKKKVILYLWTGREAFYYKDAIHPILNEAGKTVMMNEYIFKMAKPLLLEQDFIEDVRLWNGEMIEVNFDEIRDRNINMPNGSISRWYFITHPKLACDLSNVWLNVPENKDLSVKILEYKIPKNKEVSIDYFTNKIIVNRTERYTNPMISYFFLKKYKKKLVFAGTEKERSLFCSQWNLDIPLLQINNFLELAQVIKKSKFYIGNQSQCFQIAEGMKHPRMVELCNYAPNVIPIGEYAFDFYSQLGLEYYVNFLFNKK